MEELKKVESKVVESSSKEVDFDFSKLVVDDLNFCDYDFKRDFILSIRLSYGEEKQKSQVFKDYVKFLVDLKVIDINNNINIDNEKSSSYYFIFRKNDNFDNFFNQLDTYLKTNNNEKLQSLLDCYNDLKTINFTIANFKEKKDKVKSFITFCKNQNLIA